MYSNQVGSCVHHLPTYIHTHAVTGISEEEGERNPSLDSGRESDSVSVPVV